MIKFEPFSLWCCGAWRIDSPPHIHDSYYHIFLTRNPAHWAKPWFQFWNIGRCEDHSCSLCAVRTKGIPLRTARPCGHVDGNPKAAIPWIFGFSVFFDFVPFAHFLSFEVFEFWEGGDVQGWSVGTGVGKLFIPKFIPIGKMFPKLEYFSSKLSKKFP